MVEGARKYDSSKTHVKHVRRYLSVNHFLKTFWALSIGIQTASVSLIEAILTELARKKGISQIAAKG